MNKSLIKNSIIIWAVVLVVAVALLAAFALGGIMKNPFSFSINFGSVGRSDYVVVKELEVEDNISSFYLDWISGSVNIEKSTNNTIKIVQTAGENFPDNDLFKSKVNNGKLTVTDGRKGTINIGFKVDRGTDITVYLPEKVFDTIDISCVSSGVSAEDLKADNFYINTVSGAIRASGEFNVVKLESVSGAIKSDIINGKTGIFKTTSGGVSVTGDFSDFTMETVSGGIKAQLEKIPDKLRSSAVSGKITLILPENDGFTMDFSKVSGNLRSDFALTITGNKHVYKNGEARFSVSTVSGNLELVKG